METRLPQASGEAFAKFLSDEFVGVPEPIRNTPTSVAQNLKKLKPVLHTIHLSERLVFFGELTSELV